MPEKILQANLDALGIERINFMGADEWTIFGNVHFPTFLVTEQNYRATLDKAGIIFEEVQNDLRKGTPTGDAGDTHGMYHNELGWYREQLLEATANETNAALVGFDRAVVIPDYGVVRTALQEKEVDPSKSLTLSSKAKIQYGDDPTDVEDIILVARLDGGANQGWVSVETPLAKALQGKGRGDIVSFKPSKDAPPIQIKILDLE